MSLSKSNSATVRLNSLGAKVPDATTVDLCEVTPGVFDLELNGRLFTVEVSDRTGELTACDGGRPERVPQWLEAVMVDRVGLDGVTL